MATRRRTGNTCYAIDSRSCCDETNESISQFAAVPLVHRKAPAKWHSIEIPGFKTRSSPSRRWPQLHAVPHREGGGGGNHNRRCVLLIVGGEGLCAANNFVTVARPLNPPPVLRDSRQSRVHGGRGNSARGAQMSADRRQPRFSNERDARLRLCAFATDSHRRARLRKVFRMNGTKSTC